MSDYREQPQQESALDKGVNKGVKAVQSAYNTFKNIKRGITVIKGVVAAGSFFTTPVGIAAVIIGAILILIIIIASILSSLALPGYGGPTPGTLDMIKTVRKAPDGQANTRLIYTTNDDFKQLPDGEFEYLVSISLPAQITSAVITGISDQIIHITHDGRSTLASVDTFTDVVGNPYTPVGQALTSSNSFVSFMYKFNFPNHTSGEFDDSLLMNNVTVSFDIVDAQGNLNSYTQTISANIAIGDAPVLAGEGCWPTTGIITQGPYAGFSHSRVDALDIFAEWSNPDRHPPIIATFNGSIQFYDERFVFYGGSQYGMAAELTTTDGTKIVFAHMDRFAPQFSGGNSYQVTAGTVIGYVGNSGTGRALGSMGNRDINAHLHYELRPVLPPPSVIQKILPETLITNSDPEWGVPRNQFISHETCSSSATSPQQQEQARVACYSLQAGSKQWSPDELNTVTSELNRLFENPGMEDKICSAGDITILREDINPDSNTEGCNYDGTGEAGAEWTGETLHVCDKLFAEPNQFGIYTIWHESGHAFQKRNISLWSSYPNFGSSRYLKTYPLGKTRYEDFAEAFGLCLYNLSRNSSFMTVPGPASFRNQTLNYSEYADHCNSIYNIIR